METVQIRAELFREMNPMLDSKEMLQKMLLYVRTLFAEQKAGQKQEQINHLNHAFSEFKQMQAGTIEGIAAEDLLNEL